MENGVRVNLTRPRCLILWMWVSDARFTLIKLQLLANLSQFVIRTIRNKIGVSLKRGIFELENATGKNST